MNNQQKLVHTSNEGNTVLKLNLELLIIYMKTDETATA